MDRDSQSVRVRNTKYGAAIEFYTGKNATGELMQIVNMFDKRDVALLALELLATTNVDINLLQALYISLQLSQKNNDTN